MPAITQQHQQQQQQQQIIIIIPTNKIKQILKNTFPAISTTILNHRISNESENENDGQDERIISLTIPVT